PVYNATSFNGKPGIRFDTTNSELLKLTNLMFSDPNEIYCITAINRDLAIGNGNGLWFGHRSEGTRLIQFSGVTAADEILMQLRGSGASLVQVSGAPTGGAEYVGEYQFDVTGSDTFVRVNAGTKTSDTTNFG
ncbi:MAG: hypothetical protein GWN00_29860, partial [Aliifodinibius sp.]|nr:hypothetical protein [Fodinibius sp.]NIV15007.1 hypothetical protein [Fodinibius sp.]NIY28844.1 hypothetical protein [Fodinibius sp.]